MLMHWILFQKSTQICYKLKTIYVIGNHLNLSISVFTNFSNFTNFCHLINASLESMRFYLCITWINFQSVVEIQVFSRIWNLQHRCLWRFQFRWFCITKIYKTLILYFGSLQKSHVASINDYTINIQFSILYAVGFSKNRYFLQSRKNNVT